MANLLHETKKVMSRYKLYTKDIIFIGSECSGHQCSWTRFRKLANQDYDNGFGAQKVASDLIIVFKDGSQMFRGEYDGSEYWCVKRPFIPPKEKKNIYTLFAKGVGWENLLECN